MSKINLQDGKIEFEGEWLSTEDITEKINEKIQTNDLKFAGLAAALEELNKALEDSKLIEAKIVLSNEEYTKLKELAHEEDDQDCVNKAITAYIQGGSKPEQTLDVQNITVVKCPRCNEPIDIDPDNESINFECPKCGTSGRLKSDESEKIHHTDHFLG